MNNPRQAGKAVRLTWWFLGIVVLAGAIPAGALALQHVLSASSADALLWRLAYAFAGWLIAAGLAVYALRFFTRRLREGRAVIERAKSGESSARLDAHGPAELADFYREVNSLVDSLAEKSRTYESILGTCAGCGVFATDAEGAIAAWNRGAAAMLGVGGEMKGRKIWSYLKDGEENWRRIVAMSAGQEEFRFETTVIREKAVAVPVEMLITPRRDAEGRTAGYVLMLNDMSRSNKKESDLASYADKLRALVEERSDELLKKNGELERINTNMARLHEKMEKHQGQLQVAHDFLDNLLHTIPTGVMTVATDGVITSFNKAAEEITGFGAAEVIGQKCAVLRGDPCTRKCGLFAEGREEPLKGRKCTITARDGRGIAIIKNASFLRDSSGNVIGGVESFVDVTQLEETEKKYREVDTRLQKILTCAADVAIVTTDCDGMITSFNEGASRLTGWAPSEAVGRKGREIFSFPRESGMGQTEILARARAEGRFEGHVEFPHKTGGQVRAYLTLMPLTNAEGEHYGYVAVSHAASAGKDFVSPVERISHEIVMTMPEPCLMLDDKGVVSCANDAAGRILQAENGKEWRPEFDSADEWWSGEALERMLRDETPHPVAFEAMVGHRYYEITLTPVTDPDAAGALIVTGRDATESAVLKRQLVQQDKMATVGMLTAGVAHEFNNLLGGMLGYASLAKSDAACRDKLVEVVESEGGRAREIVQGLLDYSRKEMKGAEMADARAVTDEVLKLVARDMEKRGINVVRDYQNAPKTLMNVGQIEQVLLNLFVNARQAMEKGGTLTVGTRRERDNVLITVADTGCGIRHEDRHKIFQPFYTTKGGKDGRQEGTGLGLSVSSNILKQHRGSIRVASEVGKGSTFTVALPVVQSGKPKTAPIDLSEVQSVAPARKARRILIVDDEAVLRSLYSEILTSVGHEVVCVDSGRKAVELAGTDGFDLLFLDITLAGEWDGIEVFKRVRATNEAIKIILSTGSVEHAHIQPYIDQADAFLQKPFTMNDLLPLVDSL